MFQLVLCWIGVVVVVLFTMQIQQQYAQGFGLHGQCGRTIPKDRRHAISQTIFFVFVATGNVQAAKSIEFSLQ